MPGEWITIAGAREHNLKNITVRLPRRDLNLSLTFSALTVNQKMPSALFNLAIPGGFTVRVLARQNPGEAGF